MAGTTQQTREWIVTAAYSAAAALAVCGMIAFPAEAFEASMQGLRLWWDLVFPALLPFFILCEIVTAYGFARGLGVLMEPLTRRLLGLPGTAGWPIAAGLVAGSPAGADAAVRLRKENAVTAKEAERMVALTHFANPVFMYIIVPVVFMNRPELGPFLLAVHYGSLLICAWAARPFGGGKLPPAARRASRSRIGELAAAMREQHRRDGRSLGKLLGDAVTESLQKLFMIGGTMMIFSVLLQLLRVSGLMPETFRTAAAGIAELHLGAYAAARAAEWPEAWIVAAICGIAGWGGLAVHLQVRALLAGTGIRYAPFFAARVLHAGIAAAAALFTWEPYATRFAAAWPVLSPRYASVPVAAVPGLWEFYRQWLLLLFAVLLLAAVRSAWTSVKRREGRRGERSSGSGNGRRHGGN